jgi:exosortase N
MNLTITPWQNSEYKRYCLLIALTALAVAGAVSAFSLIYVSNSNVLIGIALLPFVVFIDKTARFNYLYLAALIIFGGLALLYDLKIFYFFALAFYLLFLFELLLGKVNVLILFLIAAMSPFFLTIATILGFPIRLKLSEWAGDLLQLAGLDVQVEGNMMVLNGFGFSVDEACMGLNMLAISLLMGVFVMASNYKKFNSRLSFKYLSLFFVVALVLNIISNLFRIMILVVFKILPENPMHEFIGIIGLVIYVIMPLYFISSVMVKRWGTLPATPAFKTVRPAQKIMLVVIGLSVMGIGFTIDPNGAHSRVSHAQVTLAGMEPIKMDGGITKMSDENLLIYVKPIPEFFSAEHTPLICWKGSGYHFKKISKTNIGGKEIYSGILSKGEELLYTSWWFTNGNIETIDQMEWRISMFKGGERFYLVNVTAKDETLLMQKVNAILNNKLLVFNNQK